MSSLHLGLLTPGEKGDFRLQRRVKACFVELLTRIEMMYHNSQVISRDKLSAIFFHNFVISLNCPL